MQNPSIAWSFSAKAISAIALAEAFNNPELKNQLEGVSIQKVVEFEVAKCPGCSKLSVQGTKVGVLYTPVDSEMIFQLNTDLFSQKLNVTIESETKK